MKTIWKSVQTTPQAEAFKGPLDLIAPVNINVPGLPTSFCHVQIP